MKLLNFTLLFVVVLLSCNGGKNGYAKKLSNSLIEDSVLFETDHTSDSIDNENWVSNNSFLDDYSLNNLESEESLRQI